MGWIGCVRYEKFLIQLHTQTCPLIAPVQSILHWVSCSNETLPNAPKTKKCSKTWVYGPMGWIGCVCCEKFLCDFMAQTCALIAPVQPVLHWVSCSNKTLTNAPKHYETHQYMSLGSNGLDRVRSLRKILCDFVERTFALFAPVQPVLHRVSCSTEKKSKMHPNTTKRTNTWF